MSDRRRPHTRHFARHTVHTALLEAVRQKLERIVECMDTTLTHIVASLAVSVRLHRALDERVRAAELRRTDLARRLEARDDVIAHLFAENDRLQTGLALASEQLQHAEEASYEAGSDEEAPGADADGACCLTCFETAARYVRCGAGHPICTACVERESARLLRASDTAELSPAGVPCCAHGECDAFVALRDCMLVASGRRLAEEVHFNRSREHVLAALRLGGDAARVAMRLGLIRADGTYNARQCATCGYGPLLHAHCDDLREHHGLVSGPGGATYDNACPRCRALKESVVELPRWDGRFA